jgi:hypothetical protein
MPQLIVRNIESTVVQRLKECAARDGVSMEEEHRQILRKHLINQPPGKKLSFLDFIKTMPSLEDEVFDRPKSKNRKLEL